MSEFKKGTVMDLLPITLRDETAVHEFIQGYLHGREIRYYMESPEHPTVNPIGQSTRRNQHSENAARSGRDAVARGFAPVDAGR